MNDEMRNVTDRWLNVQQLLKQKNVQYQQNERLKIMKDYESEIDLLLSQIPILCAVEQKNEQTLTRYKVTFLQSFTNKFGCI